ncbi:MAG: hypothetical protein IPN76_00115 [Saprospiraceae bacterium]|nr:hypothetical protein [Saprospiraceae bacterium]
MNYSFPAPGDYEVRVSAGNVCFQADPLCQTVHVAQLQSYFAAQICQGETLAFGGNSCSASGNCTAIFIT